MKCLLLGNNGREAIIAEYLSKGYEVYAILPFKNETIVGATEKSGGKYFIGSPTDKDLVRKVIREENIELVFINSDSILEAGLIDTAKEEGTYIFGPTREGAKIEWSKSYALDIVGKLAPEMVVKNFNITSVEQLNEVYEEYENTEFVVKPEGLTGGKGVKVGGVHFTTKDEGFEYAKKCLIESGNVIIQDKVDGYEFTVMGFTDGKTLITAPATYDHPYRFDGDEGPGTGGMGCISFPNELLPFLTKEDMAKCEKIMTDVLNYINKDGLKFNGVLYGAFFKTKGEIKFLEFNSRIGDPEALNVITALETPFHEVVKSIAINGNLSKENCKFKKEATCIVYIVSKSYAVKDDKEQLTFNLDASKMRECGVEVYFASSEQVGNNTYRTTGNSRLVAVIASDSDIRAAKERVYKAIRENVPAVLDYRTDIGNAVISL